MFTMKSSSKLFLVMVFVIYFITTLSVRYGLSQEYYPNRPITIVVPYAPGGYDSVCRVVAKAAEKELGQPLVIENKPGAGGTVAASHVLKAKPDGYTLMFLASPIWNVLPYTMNVQYDPFKDITDICGLFKHSHSFAVKDDSPFKTIQELIAYAKKNPPGTFKYGCTGKGASQHMAFEYIAMKEGIKFTMIPFGSGGESTMALLGGHVGGVAAGSFDLIPLHKAGKLRILVSLNDFRLPDFPEIPSMMEIGYSGYGLTITGVSGPKGIPEAVIKKLEKAFEKATKDPAFIQTSKDGAYLITFMTGKEYTESWKSRVDVNREMVKALGLLIKK